MAFLYVSTEIKGEVTHDHMICSVFMLEQTKVTNSEKGVSVREYSFGRYNTSAPLSSAILPSLLLSVVTIILISGISFRILIWSKDFHLVMIECLLEYLNFQREFLLPE